MKKIIILWFDDRCPASLSLKSFSSHCIIIFSCPEHWFSAWCTMFMMTHKQFLLSLPPLLFISIVRKGYLLDLWYYIKELITGRVHCNSLQMPMSWLSNILNDLLWARWKIMRTRMKRVLFITINKMYNETELKQRETSRKCKRRERKKMIIKWDGEM